MKRNIKIKSASFPVSLGNVAENLKKIKELIIKSEEEKVNILSLPELCLTGASLYDGYLEEDLLKEAFKGFKDLLDFSEDKDLVFTIGLPVKKQGKLFNTVILIKSGDVLGNVIKENLKTYEKTIFSSDTDIDIDLSGQGIYNSGACPIYVSGLYIGISIGEDEKDRIPKSMLLKEQNAGIILNPSAIPRHIGFIKKLRDDISYLSKDIIYVHTPACLGESSTDFVYEDKSIIAENGEILASDTGIFSLEVEDEHHYTNFNNFTDEPYHVEKFPYLPKEEYSKEYMEDAIEIQALGLIQRMRAVGTDKVYLGVSGGVDSTAVLLAITKAYEMAGFDKEKIGAYTMPAFGTSDRTKSNAYLLCQALGIDLKEINISKSVTAHLHDIGHDGKTPDLAYENAQARMRTQVLFDLSNMGGGLVIGTGDLSENMQGFATYNGDHMASYGVNATLMKTELRYLIKSYAHFTDNDKLKKVLTDILATPISPELVSEKAGEITQKTEDIIGPYELLDFFIYHHLTYHKSARQILTEATYAFGDSYDEGTIKKWLKSYFKRFAQSQFKRSTAVDGPDVTGRSFSPRLGFKIASDMASDLYLGDLDEK